MWMIFLAYAIMCSEVLVSKSLLLGMSSMAFVAIKTLISGSLMLAYCLKRNQSFGWNKIKHDIPYFLALAVVFTFLPTSLRAVALKYLPSSHASFFSTLGPYLTACYAYLIFGEKLSIKKIVGMILGALSCVVIFAPDLHSLMHVGILNIPACAGIGAVALVKFKWIAVQDRLRSEAYTPMELNSVSMFIAGLCAFTSVLIFDRSSLYAVADLINLKYAAAFIYSIGIGSIFAHSFYAISLKKYSATFMALTQYLIPVFVAFYGWVLLGEPVTVSFVIAALIMLLGLLIFYADELKEMATQRLALQ